jgi:hypothetical protein
MKVLVKSDRVPIALMVIGAAFVVVSALGSVERYYKLLFPMGFAILLGGFMLWAIPTFLKSQRKKARKRSRPAGPPSDEGQPRRYARPRR